MPGDADTRHGTHALSCGGTGIAPSSRGYPAVRGRVVLRLWWSRWCMGRARSASFAALAAATPRRERRGEAGKSQRREESNALEQASDR